MSLHLRKTVKRKNLPTIKKTKVEVHSLQKQVALLQTLTTLACTVLPEGHAWQVASLNDHELCIAAQHHAAASKLRYMQAQLIQQLNQLQEFSMVTELKVILVPAVAYPVTQNVKEPATEMTQNTKNYLSDISKHFLDPKISEILMRLASNK